MDLLHKQNTAETVNGREYSAEELEDIRQAFLLNLGKQMVDIHLRGTTDKTDRELVSIVRSSLENFVKNKDNLDFVYSVMDK